MHIAGEWFRFDDGVFRPIVRGRVLGVDGKPITDRFLVDVGADQSVFSASLLSKLSLPTRRPAEEIGMFGAGGRSEFVVISTVLELDTIGAVPDRIRGEFAGFAGTDDLGLSLLGRDVLNHFDVIVSRRNNEVAMLAGNHRYQIVAVPTG